MGFFSLLVQYLFDPLTLFGILLFIGFLAVKFLIKKEVITKLPPKLDNPLGKLLLSYGFILGILVSFLGLSITKGELEQAKEQNALSLLNYEFDQNFSTLAEMSGNIDSLIISHKEITDLLRSDGSEILTIIFPRVDAKAEPQIDIGKLVESSFYDLKLSGNLKNKEAMADFNESKNTIKPTVKKHYDYLHSIKDPEKSKFVIIQEAWNSHREILKNVDGFNVNDYEKTLLEMSGLINKYHSVLKVTTSYFSDVNVFMDRNTFIGNGAVYDILMKERATTEAIVHFRREFTSQLKQFRSVKLKLRKL